MRNKAEIFTEAQLVRRAKPSIGRNTNKSAVGTEAEAPPDINFLLLPRWNHWYQRKLARPWQATLLGMNIEPVRKARKALKEHHPEKYKIFIDRLDIVKTLVGYEISIFDDHVREGDGADGKYIELAEYCQYAESLCWNGMEHMRAGLMLDKKPPILKSSSRQQDNLLRVLDLAFKNIIPEYFNAKGERSSTSVTKWFAAEETDLPVSEGTLRSWFTQLIDIESTDRTKGLRKKP